MRYMKKIIKSQSLFKFQKIILSPKRKQLTLLLVAAVKSTAFLLCKSCTHFINSNNINYKLHYSVSVLQFMQHSLKKIFNSEYVE